MTLIKGGIEDNNTDPRCASTYMAGWSLIHVLIQPAVFVLSTTVSRLWPIAWINQIDLGAPFILNTYCINVGCNLRHDDFIPVIKVRYPASVLFR